MTGVRGQRMAPRPATPEEKIDFHAGRPTEHGCLPWTGSIDPDGYGRVLLQGRPMRAHRVAYELYYGEIPGGLTLDHLCRVRRCVNPLHLEAVPHHVNCERKAWTHRRAS